MALAWPAASKGQKFGGVFLRDLLLNSLVRKQPVYWSTQMIANPNYAVKFETYEYLIIIFIYVYSINSQIITANLFHGINF
jgi:hypothetical protein